MQTLAELRDADLPYVGAGRDLDEARKPVVITRDGVRIGFLGTESIGETPAATADRARHQPAEHAAADRPAERAPARPDQPATSPT